MQRATGGVNAHRGAIVSLGLLCAAAAQCLREYDAPAERICRLAGELVAPHAARTLAALTPETARSFGEVLYAATGIRGARGEAADGFPSLTGIALPMLEKYAALGAEAAGARTLIHLLAQTDDLRRLRGYAGLRLFPAGRRRGALTARSIHEYLAWTPARSRSHTRRPDPDTPSSPRRSEANRSCQYPPAWR